MIDVASLVRRHIHALEPYRPIVPFEVLSRRIGRAAAEIVKLDANENPYGPIPAVRAALGAAPFLHIYPDPDSTALREALARELAVPIENLIAGHGSDELIDLLMRLLLEPGDRVLSCPPTFGIYSFDAGLLAAETIAAPRRPDFSLDLEAIERAVAEHRPKLLCLASPNNPDGSLVDPAALDHLLSLPLVVLLDEAYVEFAPPGSSRIGDVARRENLVVLRTFSKWAALAGLRIGYGAYPGALVPQLWKIKQPYTVSVAASTAAIVCLEHRAELAAVGEQIVRERARLADGLRRVACLRPFPSQANFILCRVVERSAAELARALAGRGIVVRSFDSPPLADCLRISVGRPEHTEILLRALAELG
jgi:histidinol-phosphate aminotransferase